MIACCSLRGASQQRTTDVHALLPPAAVVKRELSVDFENNGTADTVLLYNVPDTSDNAYYHAGIQVLKNSPRFGWAVAFEEPFDGLMPGADVISIENLKSAGGKGGVLVINYHSGAGTATAWHVLASVSNKIAILDPATVRNNLLKSRGYVDEGYNGVKSKGDLIIEDLAGYSRHAARCCPNRPSLEMSFRFIGGATALDSVKELPYGLPKSGPHGPLLRLTARGLWAYGYKVADGFLVLGGSESPSHDSDSMAPAIVTLRKSLLNQGVLADTGGYLILMADYKFTSLSVAASVMLARAANGRIEWRDENGRPAGPLVDVKRKR